MNKIIIILLIVTNIAGARLGKEPVSQQFNLVNKDLMELYQLNPVDIRASLKKYQPKAYESKPVTFAIPNVTKIDLTTHGKWTKAPGGKIWNLRFQSENATDINFGFTKFHLPKGAELYFISFADDPVYYDGPYTYKDNREYNQFWSAPLPGGDVAIELFVPENVSKNIELELTKVSTGFRDVFKRYNGDGLIPKQGACNNDVVCPVGDPWRDEIRSVAAYTLNGSDTCSGTMVMDADRSFTPYFLTAAHCNISAGNAATMVTIWNYESVNCGDLSGGSRIDTVSGAFFRASRTNVDVSLVELASTPPEDYNVYWAGWDKSGVTPNGSVGIHHPGVDEKAISFNTDALTTINSCIGTGGVNSHWQVDNWEDGTTEPGSSGSGLWDPDTHLLVGFLSGGTASCSSITMDCYGKVSEAWDDGSGAASNLKTWLDPSNTGVDSIAGSNPNPFSLTLQDPLIAVCSGDTAVGTTVDVGVSPPFVGSVTLSSSALPSYVSNFTFATNPINPTPGSSPFTFDVLAGGTTGLATLTIQGDGVDGGIPVSANVELSVLYSSGTTSAVSLSAPANSATNVALTPTFSWAADANATSYRLMVSTDPGFSTLLIDETVTGNSFVASGLPGATQLYWKVATQSACNGADVESSVFSFTTVEVFCTSVPVAIPDNNAAGVDVTLSVAAMGTLDSITASVKSGHTYPGDLIFTLNHLGNSVTLMDRPGGNSCGQDGIDVVFDDNSTTPVETACASTSPGIGGILKPEQPLTPYVGAEFAGDWVLHVSDNANIDTGSIDEFCIVPNYAVVLVPEITLTKTATLTTDTGYIGEADLNDVITFSVSVENTGDVALDTLVVNDTMAGVLTCTPTTLAPGAIATCTDYTYTVVQGDIDAGGSIDNTATATMTNPVDATTYNSAASTQTAINQAFFKDGFE